VAKSAARPVGIYPEIKNPALINTLDILRNASQRIEDIVLEVIQKYGIVSCTFKSDIIYGLNWLLTRCSYAGAVLPRAIRPSVKCLICDETKETFAHILIPYERLMHLFFRNN